MSKDAYGHEREAWGSRMGLILAMAGNAIGLGNFLRFPGQAVKNGGGAFMVPYFVALLLLGIPLMWCEWGIGRLGGKAGHGTTPGMFERLWKHPLAKYLGVLGIFLPLGIVIYYTYIESWTLAYAWFSIDKAYFGLDSHKAMGGFLDSFLGGSEGAFHGVGWAVGFFVATLVVNVWILSRGLSRGIEVLAKVAMPLLFLFAIVLVVRVFTLGTPDPAMPDRNVWDGLAFVWTPNFSRLGDGAIWLAAAGQIFFTLSLGTGAIQTYASYVKEEDDIVLTGLATASTNEFAEVILGGSLAIPASVAFFGVQNTQETAGTFSLAFLALPQIFTKIPAGHIFGGLWFLLLFFAGITSSVALSQPFMAFLEDEYGLSKRKAALVLGAVVAAFAVPIVLLPNTGYLEEIDYWVGTFGLVAFGLIECVLFTWVFGMDKAWKELHQGADIRIPRVFWYVMKYVTPLLLATIFGVWLYQRAWGLLIMDGDTYKNVLGVTLSDGTRPYIWAARGSLLLLLTALLVMVGVAWRRRGPAGAGGAA